MTRTGRRFAIVGMALVVAAAVIAVPFGRGRTAHGLVEPRTDSLLVIGASYTAGWGSTNPRLDYAHRLGAALGWKTVINAEPGAGYLSTGNDGHGSFPEQVRALPADLRPGLVVIQGGRDDDGASGAREYAAAIHTIELVRARFGDPQIVLLGDIPAQLPVGRSAIAISAALQRAARAEGVPFINPIRQHWMTAKNLPGFRSDVPGHPDDAGHAYIAYRLAADLQQLSHGRIRPVCPIAA
jgi:acyl-CoA thioesterase-1